MDKKKSVRKLPYPREEIKRISLGPGLELAIEDFIPEENLLADPEIEQPSLELCLYLSGKLRRVFWDIKDEIIIGTGPVALWFKPESKINIEHLPGQPIYWVGIRVEPRLLNTLIESQPEQISAELSGIIKGCKEDFFCYIGEMTASMQIAIHQIINCPYEGFTKKIYLEAKALELLAYLITDLHPENVSTILHPEEQKLVFRAREILIQNLEEPPSLLELARKVGLNEYKLKVGFREIFGTTVFGCLRHERLEHARQLLEEGTKSVTEVAYSVGYSSLSHFAKAFARHFGIKPGSYLTEIHKKGYLPLSHPENPSTIKNNPSTVSNH